ncbi:uncharacterized protein BCR38DRAFT_373035 [Pseudomassariella vexata]|uniref:Smr domain-containing protein n=1 Tax=Pseudomassariella vexata TaxID=1141098 RepID=A0A1Y2DQ19_9PEZI|nr:uncharacterized protein BCR38DRAFT_373035 [Pseudomassariella vexata]ORY61307.1 hypothetical protein BCR38DRAFT_373035 [Pseudomassariella vexata]
MEDPSAKLVDELCSLLDEATILSICSDYDLAKPQQFDKARSILLSLSKDVEVEEATGFNPSGLGVNQVVDITQDIPDELDVHGEPDSDLKSSDGLSTTTESSRSQSCVSATSSTPEESSASRVTVFDELTDAEKESQLLEMFTSLKPIDVKLALRNSKGDASVAIDELLNTEFLEQTGQRVKGIDAFYVPDNATSSKRKRGTKKKAAPVRLPKSSNRNLKDLSEEPNNHEETSRRDIAYVAERLNTTEIEISSIYFRHNSSMGATVVEILENYLRLGMDSSDRALFTFPGAEEQAAKYSWVPAEYLRTIFEITSPKHQFALDLIGVLGDYFEKPAYLKYEVAYNVAASKDHGLLEGGTSINSPKLNPSNAAHRKTAALPHPLDFQFSTNSSTDLAASRDRLYASASSAYKRARSDPLFRQVGSVYAERAREQAKIHRQMSSVEAGYHVDSTATSDMIDLHGVTVQDGVDIAISRVWKWWNTLGEDRARKAREGFTVITGLGRHSADGKSRLRANVFKALVADGWKIEVLTGQYLVTGRRLR